MENKILFQKEIDSYGHYDVVVLGGGPAGVCAAVEAARNGAKVLLVEAAGMLGGMATTAMVGPLMTVYDRDGNRLIVGGLYREIVERLAKYSAVIPPEKTDSPSIYTSYLEKYHRHVTPFDSYMLQVVLDEMTEEAGVEVLLYTRFSDCICENGKIQTIIVNALEGLRAISADVFIDCTGNADVAHAAGVKTHKGDEESGIPQPATLMFDVDNVVDEEYWRGPKRPVKAYRTSTPGRYKVNHHRVFNVDATDSKSMSEAHKKARKQVLEAYEYLLTKTGFKNCNLAQVASVLGVRESRHIDGKYRITIEDVANGTKFEDRIAVYGFGMDVHPRTEEESGNFKVEVAEAYYVPYRSMVPNGCQNLLVAGKTISCASQAAGGIRCMPCAMAMGQAAGVASALAAKNGIHVEDIDVAEMQTILRKHGAILD